MSYYAEFIETNKSFFNSIDTQILEIDKHFISFFDFQKILLNSNDGKTKLNKFTISKSYEAIHVSIRCIKEELEELIVFLDKDFKEFSKNYNILENYSLKDNLLFEIQLAYEEDIKNKTLSKNIKKTILAKFTQKLTFFIKLKNLIFLCEEFDIKDLHQKIQATPADQLKSSSFIYKIIDLAALYYELFKNFRHDFQNIDKEAYELTSLHDFDSIVKLYTYKLSNYQYTNNTYNINVEYQNDFIIEKPISIELSLLLNIIASLLKTSCADLIKKEFRLGKYLKNIEVIINKKGKYLKISIINNGLEKKDIEKIFTTLNEENSLLLQINGLCEFYDIKLDIHNNKNSQVEYSVEIPI